MVRKDVLACGHHGGSSNFDNNVCRVDCHFAIKYSDCVKSDGSVSITALRSLEDFFVIDIIGIDLPDVVPRWPTVRLTGVIDNGRECRNAWVDLIGFPYKQLDRISRIKANELPPSLRGDLLD